ncbi:MAG: epimerase [Frondihabitans sp.]|nr:epimerase [Frondihabitans sp.]
MSIVVTGATGQLGRLAIAELLSAGVSPEQIVATGRDRAKLASVAEEFGVQIRHADFADSATLGPAFAGADKLLLISTTDVGLRIGNHQRAIDAAREAGVGLIVYTSTLNAETATMRLAEEHRLTESYLTRSGVPFVILRNGWYLERYTDQLSSVLEHGTLVGGTGNGLVAAATRRDYAAAAAAVLTQDGHTGSIYDLGGEPFTLTQIAATISEVSGVPVTSTNLSVDDYAAALASEGLPEDLALVLADADAGIERGELHTDSDDLKNLIGRAPTTARELVRQTLAESAAAG